MIGGTPRSLPAAHVAISGTRVLLPGNRKSRLLKLLEVLLGAALHLNGRAVPQGRGDLLPPLHLHVFGGELDEQLLQSPLLLGRPRLVEGLGLLVVENAAADENLAAGILLDLDSGVGGQIDVDVARGVLAVRLGLYQRCRQDTNLT